MDKNKLYGSWYIWEELVSYPMMLYYWIKGDKIEGEINNILYNIEIAVTNKIDNKKLFIKQVSNFRT